MYQRLCKLIVNLRSPESESNKTKRLRIGIVGGSLSGLFAARALQSIGCDVQIFERRTCSEISSGGIIITHPLMDYLDKYNIFSDKTMLHKNIISNTNTSTIHDDSTVTTNIHPETIRSQTSYDCLYYNLLNPKISEVYNKGKNLRNIATNKRDIDDYLFSLEFDDGTSFDCDLVIGADGIGSTTRNFISANESSSMKYAGYVCWRGLVEGKDIDKRLQSSVYNWRTDHTWMLYIGDKSLFLNYMIPNYHDLNSVHNDVLYNIIWYVKYTPDQIQNAPFLTDKNGKRHKGGVARGLLTNSSLKHFKENADNLLEKTCADLVKKTKEPFFQVIHDYKCSKMSEYVEENGKEGGIALMGDAAFVIRPHVTKSTSKAAGDAMTLKKYLLKYKKNEMSLKEALTAYNKERWIVGSTLCDKSIELGMKVVEKLDKDFAQKYVVDSSK